MRMRVTDKKILLVLYVLAVLVRLYAISGNSIFFYFDQARDAAISRSILEQGDIKIQGPSVSGTSDSVYHGVLYYYVIGPLYTLSAGNPVFVATVLAVVSSSSVFVLYLIGAQVFASPRAGLLAAGLMAVSAVGVHQHIWLSNPMLTSLTVPASYLFLWRVMYQKRRRVPLWEYAALGGCVALSMQAALQSVVLVGSVFVAWLFVSVRDKKVWLPTVAQLLVGGSALVLGVSTMIATEVLLWYRGILSAESLHLSDHRLELQETVRSIIERYAEILVDVTAPSSVWLAVISLVILVWALYTVRKSQFVWSLSFLFAPLWLLLWQYRDPPHTFIGLEQLVYLLISVGVVALWRQKHWMMRAGVVGFALLLMVVQLYTVQLWKQQRVSYYGIQKGALLQEQLELIDQSYQSAQTEPFSIATLTSPFAINSTWGYLYDWHGQRKYGFTPSFTGMPQAGYPGAGQLAEVVQPLSRHFVIVEPDTTLADDQIEKFLAEQAHVAGNSENSWEFGTLQLQQFGHMQ